jgi:hypothetical protein
MKRKFSLSPAVSPMAGAARSRPARRRFAGAVSRRSPQAGVAQSRRQLAGGRLSLPQLRAGQSVPVRAGDRWARPVWSARSPGIVSRHSSRRPGVGGEPGSPTGGAGRNGGQPSATGVPPPGRAGRGWAGEMAPEPSSQGGAAGARGEAAARAQVESAIWAVPSGSACPPRHPSIPRQRFGASRPRTPPASPLQPSRGGLGAREGSSPSSSSFSVTGIA